MFDIAQGHPDAPAVAREEAVAAAGPLCAWVVLVAVTHVWGRALITAGHRLQLGPDGGTPPIVGEFVWRLGPRALPAVIVAGALVATGPALAARWPWRRLLVGSAAAAATFAVALALVDPDGLTRGLLGRGEYLHDIGAAADPGAFLASFTDRLATYDTHVQGHPPGLVLLFAAVDRVGFPGAGPAAALVIAGGALAAAATLSAARGLAGEAIARRSAPFLVLSPAAIWVASSGDALYAGLLATGVALLVGAGARPGRSGDPLAVGAGGAFAAALFSTYGAAAAFPLVVAVCWLQRRLRPLVVAGIVVLAVTVSFAAAGFWWFDGLAATRVQYFAGVASHRPYGYFLFANLGALALMVGPAVSVGLAALFRSRRSFAGLSVLVGAGVATVALADVSGLSKAEVERIWLPFAPWILLAGATLRASRRWLAVQAGAAVLLALSVRTPW